MNFYINNQQEYRAAIRILADANYEFLIGTRDPYCIRKDEIIYTIEEAMLMEGFRVKYNVEAK